MVVFLAVTIVLLYRDLIKILNLRDEKEYLKKTNYNHVSTVTSTAWLTTSKLG